MTGMSRYQINEQILELIVEIDAAEASENTELVAKLEASLRALYPALDKKREAYVHVIRSAAAHASALRTESNRFAKRARNMQNLSKRLKQALHDDLAENGEIRADAGVFRLAIANSPPSVKLSVAPEKLPIEFQVVSVSANTALIGKELRSGQSVEGAELVRRTHLRIRE